MKNWLSTLVIVLLSLLLGGVVAYQWARPPVQSVDSDSTVLVEQIRQVSQLVTVEADLHQLYNRTQTRNVTLYLPLPARFSFAKQASVQVSGRVLVGYDLSGIDVAVDDAARTVRLSKLPRPEILAVDHEIVYKDLEESWFNSFTPKDYSDLNRAAKQALRDRAIEKRLLERAEEQGNSVIETIRFLVEGAGYRLEVEGAEISD